MVWPGLVWPGTATDDGELQRSLGEYRPGDRALRRAVHIGLCSQNLRKDLRRQLRCLFAAGGRRYRLCQAKHRQALFWRKGGEIFSAFSKARAALLFYLHCFEGNTGNHKAPLWSGLFIALFQRVAHRVLKRKLEHECSSHLSVCADTDKKAYRQQAMSPYPICLSDLRALRAGVVGDHVGVGVARNRGAVRRTHEWQQLSCRHSCASPMSRTR
jgi:hypothetical protein